VSAASAEPRTLAWTRRMLLELPSLHPAPTERKPLRENNSEYAAFVAALKVEPSIFTPRQREALTAVFLDARSMQAAAVHIGMSLAALRERLMAARVSLRAWLRREASTLAEQVAQ
jgi:DNA-directed RNA polymerase specialized sigma24 family protein